MKKMKFLKLSITIILSITLLCCDKTKENSESVKNVIILIPDGTSTALLTLARWYNDNNPLTIDPYICGMIKTHCSDGKFPDSAPTSTAYSIGIKTISPYIGLDSSANPHVSVLELAKIKGLSTGIVVTCEFPHATPADFVCHLNNRDNKNNYKNLAKQFIDNSPTLVFAGGEKYLDINNYHKLLIHSNIDLIKDTSSFNKLHTHPKNSKSIWALFPDWQGNTRSMSHHCDRDIANAPSLSEMTKKAIDILQQNNKGFFLLVEGSQIDWAAHNNDPFAAVTDFLEFDNAVAIAIDFAKKNKNTVVIICPDHGTGGINLGNQRSGTDFITENKYKYDKLNINDNLIEPLKKIKYSSRKIAQMILNNSEYISKPFFDTLYNLKATDNFLASIKEAAKTKNIDTIQYLIGTNFSMQNFIGWTSTGHTAEDVFLAIYAPEHIQKITGVVDNDSIGRYIAKILNDI